VIDASGSMTGAKLADAQSAALAFVDAMRRANDWATVVEFNQAARVAVPLTGNRDALAAGLRALAIAPGTRLDRGLAEALAELQSPRHAPSKAAAIVVLSDGGQTEDPDTAVAVADAARAAGVAVYAIGIGADANEALLIDVAGDSAHYRDTPTPAMMAALYAEISSALP
jgi:Ca-activated chloride channel family protein